MALLQSPPLSAAKRLSLIFLPMLLLLLLLLLLLPSALEAVGAAGSSSHTRSPAVRTSASST